MCLVTETETQRQTQTQTQNEDEAHIHRLDTSSSSSSSSSSLRQKLVSLQAALNVREQRLSTSTEHPFTSTNYIPTNSVHGTPLNVREQRLATPKDENKHDQGVTQGPSKDLYPSLHIQSQYGSEVEDVLKARGVQEARRDPAGQAATNLGSRDSLALGSTLDRGQTAAVPTSSNAGASDGVHCREGGGGWAREVVEAPEAPEVEEALKAREDAAVAHFTPTFVCSSDTLIATSPATPANNSPATPATPATTSISTAKATKETETETETEMRSEIQTRGVITTRTGHAGENTFYADRENTFYTGSFTARVDVLEVQVRGIECVLYSVRYR